MDDVENVVSDTEGLDSSETETDTETETETETGGDSEGQLDTETEIQTDKPATYVPFTSGKEKFKIDGKEEEWDWEETKRWAQLGKSGFSAKQELAAIKKSHTTFQQNLLKAARENPEGLIQTLNPAYQGGKARPSSTAANAGGGEAPSDELDPRDSRIQYLEKQVEKFSGYLESQEVEQAKKEIDSELEAASEKFPVMKDEIYKEYVKNQYRRYLNEGVVDVTIEDLAFQLDQKIKDKQRSEVADKRKRLETNRQRSTVSGVAGVGSSSDRRADETGIEYAKRLAGIA